MRNCCRHSVNIHLDGGRKLRFAPYDQDGGVRIELLMESLPAHTVNGSRGTVVEIPVKSRETASYQAVRDLNATLRRHLRETDSVIVPQRCLEFVDDDLLPKVFAPDTMNGSAVRDAVGRVTAVKGLVRRTLVKKPKESAPVVIAKATATEQMDEEFGD